MKTPTGILSHRGGKALAWGFADQGFSSATNFGLSLLAGRVLGPSGLGTVFLGFSTYLIVLGLQRRLVTEPLIAASSSRAQDERDQVAHKGVTIAIASGLLASALVFVTGLVVPGFAGDGLLLIAPWLAPALVQDGWRHLMFRDRKAASATLNDGVWALVMAMLVPVAWSLGTGWAVVGAWGCGAFAGAITGFIQTRIRPAPLRASWDWWWRDAWPFGRWNASAGIAANVGTNAAAFVISAIIGSAALGGIRAAQSIFAPLTLIIPALALPGLPAVSRALRRSFREAKMMAVRLSVVALIAAGLYIAFLLLGGWKLLPLLFGEEFDQYRYLIWPIATGQIATALGIGAQLLIKAEQRGRALLATRVVASFVGLGLISLLAWRHGIEGAAWGGACSAMLSTLLLSRAALARRTDPSDQAVFEDPAARVTRP